MASQSTRPVHNEQNHFSGTASQELSQSWVEADDVSVAITDESGVSGPEDAEEAVEGLVQSFSSLGSRGVTASTEQQHKARAIKAGYGKSAGSPKATAQSQYAARQGIDASFVAADAVDESQLLMPVIDHTTSHQPARQAQMADTGPRQRRTKVGQRSRGISAKEDGKETNQGTERRNLPSVWLSAVKDIVLEAFVETGDILRMSIRNMKTPLSYAVSILIFYYLYWAVWTTVKGWAAMTLTFGVCKLPGMKLMVPSVCIGGEGIGGNGFPTGPYVPPAEFDRLMASNRHFEEVLASQADTLALPAVMKRSEASIRDLRTLVKVSTLKSRNELVLEFDHFVDTARIAVRDLAAFNSHVDRTADFILIAARWTRRVLEEIETERIASTVTSSGSNNHDDGPGIGSKLLALLGRPLPKTVEQRVLERYLEHAEAVEEQIHRLILEAHALEAVLQALDARLDAIGEVAAREDVVTADRRAHTLAELWTLLGGNRARVAKFDAELDVLRQVGRQRATAVDQLADTLLRLHAMEAELAGLRERVGATRLLAEVDSSSSSSSSNNDNRDGIAGGSGVPVTAHLDNVEAGVRRLEATREDYANKFGEFQRKAKRGDTAQLEAVIKKKAISPD